MYVHQRNTDDYTITINVEPFKIKKWSKISHPISLIKNKLVLQIKNRDKKKLNFMFILKEEELMIIIQQQLLMKN